MSDPTHSTSTNSAKKEHPSTYFVQDRSNEEELKRLQIQDQLLTTGMGGVLAEQPDLTIFDSVLDVGCGTGGWLIELANTVPSLSRLVGVDVSLRMIEHARKQATIAQVADRVEFHVGDALRMLEFPTSFFDLVNMRLGSSFLRTWDWHKLLTEIIRVLRPGGIIRITEGNMMVQSTSPALTQLLTLSLQAFSQSGHFFTQSGDGVIKELVPLLEKHRIHAIQTHLHTLIYRAGTPEGQFYYEDMKRAFRTALPFLNKWTRVPDNYETIYQKALQEMQQPDFEASWTLVTVWGTTPL